jgi:Ice-binding-like
MKYHQKYLSSCFLAIAALLCATDVALAQTAPSLGSAATFSALAGGPATGAVTCTTSTLTGDVGVVVPGTFVNTTCSISGTVNTNATGAYADFLAAYNALPGSNACTQTLTTLDGQVLSPGVYCVTAAATSTGSVLTLNGPSNGIWIFRIGTSGTGALTGTNFSVVMPGGGVPCNVYWLVAQGATMTDSNFVGTILAGADITVTRGTFVGRALAGGTGTIAAPTGAVTLTNAIVTGCGSTPAPAAGTIKVTGGGQIQVPNGTATFGFNAGTGPGGLGGHFNYVNHVTGLHVDGPVNNIVVIAFNPDGSPKTVLFSGTCGVGCAFSVTVEDNGEPGINDQFGVTVIGTISEVISQRVISNGNIQFHK